jgi:hypothetical protein
MARFTGTSWEDDGAGGVLATIVDAEGNAYHPAVASSGQGYCVAWSTFEGGGALARVHDGSSWQAPPVRLGTVPPMHGVALASDGRGYAATWAQWEDDAPNVYANVYEDASWQEDGGGPAPTLLEELPGSANRPGIASNGRGYAVAWVQQLDSMGSSSAMVIVFERGSWQMDGGHPAPAPLETAPTYMYGTAAIASDGTGYAVAWGESGPEELWLSRYEGADWSASTVETTDGLGAFPEAITSNGRRYSLIWQQQDEPGQWDTPEIWARLGM